MLSEMFDKQHVLMERLRIPAHSKEQLQEAGPASNLMVENTMKSTILAFALQDELHEFIRELNWKPWKAEKKLVDIEKAQKELIDAWHFLIELSLMWGLEAETVHALYLEKNKENHERQDKGY